MEWIQNIDEIEARFEELSEQLSDPRLLADQKGLSTMCQATLGDSEHRREVPLLERP